MNGTKLQVVVLYGYVKAESTTYIDNNSKQQVETQNNKITNLSFDINLNKPSGLTLEQFKKVLSDRKRYK